MLKIRLQRVGKKNSPSYRIVLAEHTAPPQGKFQEVLGFYNPRRKEKGFKKDRIEYWLKNGAQPSPTVHNLLISEKIIEGVKMKAWRPKKKKGGEEKKEEVKAEAKEVEPPKEEAKPAGEAEKPEEKVKEKMPEKEEKSEEVKKEEPKKVESSEEKVKSAVRLPARQDEAESIDKKEE